MVSVGVGDRGARGLVDLSVVSTGVGPRVAGLSVSGGVSSGVADTGGLPGMEGRRLGWKTC